MDDVYEKLRKRLDDMGTGFPATQNGVEIKILKRLFSEVDTELFLTLSPTLETPESIAARLNRPVEPLARHVEDVAMPGPCFARKKTIEVAISR